MNFLCIHCYYLFALIVRSNYYEMLHRTGSSVRSSSFWSLPWFHLFAGIFLQIGGFALINLIRQWKSKRKAFLDWALVPRARIRGLNRRFDIWSSTA